MKRISPSKKIADSIYQGLEQSEKNQEHDEKKIEKSIQNLREHGGLDLHMADHFEIQNYSGEAYLASPGGSKIMMIGKTKPSLKGEAYIVGREPGTDQELVYYKLTGSGIERRDCGEKAGRTVSRFDLAIFPKGDRVQIFNLGKNKKDLYFEGEAEF